MLRVGAAPTLPPVMSTAYPLAAYPLTAIASVIVIIAALTCIWIMIASLFPKFTRQAQTFCVMPLRAFLIGLVAGLVPFIIGYFLAAISSGHLGHLVGWTLMIISASLGIAGAAALAFRIGNGMPSQLDRTDPWRRTLRGSSVLALTFLLPIIGWFVWMPVVLSFGAGVALLTVQDILRARKEERELEQAETEAIAAEKGG